MVQKKICPFCGTENALRVEQCERCGRLLSAHRNKVFTTEKIAKSEPQVTGFLPSVEQLGDLTKDALVLFVDGEDEPIVLESVQTIILGRPIAEIETTRTFDLTKYGAVTLGVSRRHVQITYVDGIFMVLDLGSTNGTSLNGRFLPPTYSHRLQPYDQLSLGQLRIMVYFDVAPSVEEKVFLLTDSQAAQSLSITLDYLTDTIIPYIQALAEIQKISREVRGQPPETAKILSIQSGQGPAQVRLSLLLVDEAVDIVRQWIGPWQRIYADPALLTAELTAQNLLPQLRDLVASITDYLMISLSEAETFSLQNKLLTPVTYIAMSGLELTLESPLT